ncbi:hypothetical protein TNCV_3071901 [Trichonephila clavipes]|nr:hypothetical protein TNCV_3071901 [Trichonephila clavipes]
MISCEQNDRQYERSSKQLSQTSEAFFESSLVDEFPEAVTDEDLRQEVTDEAHFWLNGYVNKQNCRIWSEANPQVNVETPLHPEKLTAWC